MAECTVCGYNDNGELADICTRCSAPLPGSLLTSTTTVTNDTRKLKPHASHEDAPARKAPTTPAASSTIQHKARTTNERNDDTDIASMLRTMMHDMKDMKADMKEMKEQNGLLTESIDDVRSEAKSAKNVAMETKKSVDAIEQDVAALKATTLTKAEASAHIEAEVKRKLSQMKPTLPTAAHASTTNTKSDTLVFKGFTGETAQSAEVWITQTLDQLRLPTPDTIYYKGDEFKGVMFTKFASVDDSTKAAMTLGKTKLSLNTKPIQCNSDRAIEVRAPMSFMLGLRWQLSQWGTYAKDQIKVDDKTLTMKIGREPILAVSVSEGRIQLTWLNDEWSKWQELQESAELQQLITTANDSLTKASAAQPKGKGKSTGNDGQ